MRVGTRPVLGEPRAGDPRLPAGFVLGIVFALTLAVVALFQTASERSSVDGGLAVTSGIVAVAAWWSRVPVAFAAGFTGWLMINGFLVNQHGELRWHGNGDLLRLGVLVGAAVGVAGVRTAELAVRRRRVGWSFLSVDLAELASRQAESRGVRHARLHICAFDDRGVRRVRVDRAGGGEAVTAENIVGLVLAAAVMVYLVVALLFPERF